MTNHPLTNPESKHYDAAGRPAILDIEDQLTIDELIGACKFNILKYKLRLDHKGQKESDLKKIETYERYLEALEQLRKRYGRVIRTQTLGDFTEGQNWWQWL